MKEYLKDLFTTSDFDKLPSSLWDDMTPLSECVKGGKPNQATYFKALSDEKYFCFLFRVYDDFINPVRKVYNSKIYNEEVIEVFISGKDIRRYVELEVSPVNTKFCGLIKNSLKGRRKLKLLNVCIFNSTVFSKPYGYDAVITVSKKEIAKKLNLRELREANFNAFRIDRPKEGKWELSALNPTGKENFHIPEKFIKLESNKL